MLSVLKFRSAGSCAMTAQRARCAQKVSTHLILSGVLTLGVGRGSEHGGGDESSAHGVCFDDEGRGKVLRLESGRGTWCDRSRSRLAALAARTGRRKKRTRSSPRMGRGIGVVQKEIKESGGGQIAEMI